MVRHTQLTTNLTFASCALIPDFDILIAISKEQTLLNLQYHLTNSQHVKGHQGQSKKQHELTRPEQLNILADQLATEALQDVSHLKHAPSSQPNPHCPIFLLNRGQIISSKEQSTLRWKWSELRLQNYYQDIFHLKPPQLFEINWFGHQNARRTFSPSEINFSIKLTINWLPIGKMAERYGSLITYCHRCKERETLHHLFTCKMNSNAQQHYIMALTEQLNTLNTDPDICSTIIHAIKLHLHLPSQYRIPDHLQHTFSKQSQFGWQMFCSGLLLQMWSQHQQIFANKTH